MASDPSADVVILGGGPAGLLAAWKAAAAGRSVVLLEREQRVGGMAASFEVAGMRVDFGSHRLHPATPPAVLADVRALLGDELQQRVRNGRIGLGGRWVLFPLQAADVVRHLPPRLAAGAALDTALRPLRRSHDQADEAETYEDVVRRMLGPSMGRHFYFPYARKLWGCEPHELSGEQARRRISASSPGRLLRKLTTRGSRPTFLYPARGFGRIVETVADAAVAAGADIRTGAAVTAVELGDGPSAVRTASGTVTGDRLWSTLPVPVFVRLAAAPDPVVAQAAQLTSRALVLVYLVVPRRQWTPFDAHYLPGPEIQASRVSEPRNYRDGPDPDDLTVLCAEVPCDVGDASWTASATELAERTAEGLHRMGLPPVEVAAAEVRRLPAGYPIYRLGYERAFAAVDQWIGAQRSVLSFGRQGLFAHDNTHHAFAMAAAAVETLDDEGSWDAARDRFRTHVIED